jgi:hypothetical protein
VLRCCSPAAMAATRRGRRRFGLEVEGFELPRPARVGQAESPIPRKVLFAASYDE